MINKKTIVSITAYTLPALVIGVLIMVTISWYILYALDRPVSLFSIKALYQYNSVYYLLRLIPLLTTIGGVLLAIRYLKEKKRQALLDGRKRSTVASVMKFVREISNDELNHP